MAIEWKRLSQQAFLQNVYLDGYCIKRKMGDDHWRFDGIVVNSKSLDTAEFRTYAPMTSTPALYRVFAEIDDTREEAILEFISHYGFVFEHNQRRHWDMGHVTLDYEPVDPVADVASAIRYIRVCVSGLDAIRSGNPELLQEFIRTHGSAPIPLLAAAGSLNAAYEQSTGTYQQMQTADLKEAATVELGKMLQPMVLNALQTVVDTSDPENPVTRVRPRSLLSAMFLQLLQELTGERRLRKCDQCDTWFEVTSRAGRQTRMDKRFCSDACRQEAYRKRRNPKLTE